MNTNRSWMTGYIVAAVALLGMNGVGMGQVIRLKGQATVDLHQDVRLGDIATVTGGGAQSGTAEALANTVIVADIDKPLTLNADAVLMALISQHGAKSVSGNLQMGGAASCQVGLGAPALATAMVPMSAEGAAAAPAAVTGGGARGATGRSGVGVSEAGVDPRSTAKRGATETARAPEAVPANLREEIVARLERDSEAGPGELIIDVDSITPFLDEPTPAGAKWLIRPMQRTLLGSVQFEAVLAQGTKTLQRLTISTEVQRRTRVVVITARLNRGDIVTPEMVRYEERPKSQKIPTLFATEQEVIGLEAQRDVLEGVEADSRDFKPALMAHRNDLITVLYLDLPLQLQMTARAMKDAKFHDVIEVRNESTNQTYMVTMLKKNFGVTGTITAAQEALLLKGPQ